MSDKRILIIDRDATSRERLGRQFSRRGWSVALAATVAEVRAQLDTPRLRASPPPRPRHSAS